MRDMKKWHKTAGVEKVRHGKARHEKMPEGKFGINIVIMVSLTMNGLHIRPMLLSRCKLIAYLAGEQWEYVRTSVMCIKRMTISVSVSVLPVYKP